MKLTSLSLAIASALSVTACGGGGGSNNGDTGDVTLYKYVNYSSYSSASAALADGVADASGIITQICFDMNRNDSCDAEESPVSVKGVSGSAKLKYKESDNLSGINIVAVNSLSKMRIPADVLDSNVQASSASDRINLNPLTNLAYSKSSNSGYVAGSSDLASIIGTGAVTSDYGYDTAFNSLDPDTKTLSDVLLIVGYGKLAEDLVSQQYGTVSSQLNGILQKIKNKLAENGNDRTALLQAVSLLGLPALEPSPIPPDPDFNPELNVNSSADGTVRFSLTGVSDEAIVKWLFGDGGTSDEINPVHTYTKSGTYKVVVNIADNGNITQLTQNVTVSVIKNDPPVVLFLSEIKNNRTVEFTNKSEDPDGDSLTYSWDFGDNTPVSTKPSPSHQYAADGKYIVTLTVSDGHNHTVSYSRELDVHSIVTNHKPVADFSVNADYNVVTFTNNSTDEDSDSLTYVWDFGDGSAPSPEVNPKHTYAAKGSYNVTLIANDGKDNSEPKIITVNVTMPNTLPVASFDASAEKNVVTFTNKSSDADNDTLTYKWNFGDGTTSTEKNPVHTYPEANGDYNVTLIVNDGHGDSQPFTSTVKVDMGNHEPVAKFAVSVSKYQATFTNSSTDEDNDPLSYSWNFGDGSTSTEKNPVHTYASNGSYTVVLTVSDGKVSSPVSTSSTVLIDVPDQCPDSDPYCLGNAENECQEICTTTTVQVCTGSSVTGAVSDTYHSTNPNGKVGANKTISGAADWGDDTLIAVSAANDDPRAYRGYHEYPTDIYSLHAAWDDTNLYLMVEFPNLQNAETGSDFDASSYQFLPNGIAINTGKRKAGVGLMDEGGNPWNNKLTFWNIKDGLDTLLMFHPRLPTVNKPGLFLTNSEGLFSYDEEGGYLIGFDAAGIERVVYQQPVSKNYWGIANNYGGAADQYKDASLYTDLMPTSNENAAGRMYQVTIPLASIGVDSAWMTSHGVKVMWFTTMGQSPMDCLPWDPVMVDAASEPYSVEDSTSHEKEDLDIITVPLASVGKLQGNGGGTGENCHDEEQRVCNPDPTCEINHDPIKVSLNGNMEDNGKSVSITANVSTGYKGVSYEWTPSVGSKVTTAYNETTKVFTVNKTDKDQTFTLKVTAKSTNGYRTGSEVYTVTIPACSGDECPVPSNWAQSTGEFSSNIPVYFESNCKAPANSVILKYDGFTSPYLWLWQDKQNYTGGTWPGAAMTKIDGCTESFYSYTPSENVSTASAIFSNSGANQYPGQNQPGVTYTQDKPCFDFASKEFKSADACGMTAAEVTTETFVQVSNSKVANGSTIKIVQQEGKPETEYKDIVLVIYGKGVDANTKGTYSIDGVEQQFTNGEIIRVGKDVDAADTEAGEEPNKTTLVVSYGDVSSTYTITKTKYVEVPVPEGEFSWNNALVYFVMTDRFENGDSSNDGSYGRPKKDPAGHATATFHGGDIKGMTKRLDYIKSLGMNAIWITAPYEQSHGWTGGGSSGAFAHYAYHGYYALDFTSLDANMGTVDDFREFVTEAHKRGIRVVLDIVMNHSGYATLKDMCDFGFGVRKDGKGLCEDWTPGSGETYHSKPIDESRSSAWDSWWGSSWLIFGGYGEQCGAGDGLDACVSYLPDFKNSNTHGSSVSVPTFLSNKWSTPDNAHDIQAAKQYRSGSMSVAEFQAHWLASWVEEFGIDGFRCDTAKHVTKSTWKLLKEYSQEALQKWRQNNANGDDPAAAWTDDFWMTGEHWGHKTDPSDGGGYGSSGGFDSMINFAFNGQSNGTCSVPSTETWNSYAQMYGVGSGSPKLNALSYVSSHDTSLCRPSDMKNLGTMLELLPGGVQVFYGDETGRPNDNGGSGNDAEHGTRSDMNFPSDISNQAEWAKNVDTLSTSFSSNETLAHWQKVGQFRFRNVAVGAGKQTMTSDGSYCRHYVDDAKGINNSVVIHLGNASTVNVGSCFEDGTKVMDGYSGATGTVSGGSVSLSGTGSLILLEVDRTGK